MIFIGVVPIFVNTGAALLPTLAAGLASALALLFKPRELAAACRRRPLVATLVPLGAAALTAGVWYWSTRPAPPQPRRIDWAQVGLDCLRREQAGAAVPVTTQPTDGPVVLGRDYSRRGWDGGPAPDKLTPLWEYRAEDASFLSSPAVSGGRVYAATFVPDVTGKFGSGSVVCLDARTGRKLWETSEAAPGEAFKPFFSSPAVSVDGERVVIGQGLHEDADCELVCLDAATGKVCWRVPTPLHIEGSPAIHGDIVIAGAGAIENESHKPTGHGGLVLAVRISDGKVLWRFDLADPESSPAIDADGTVYIGSGFNGSAVVALRGEPDDRLSRDAKGRVAWRRDAPYPITGAVTLAGDAVLVGGGNGDYVFANPSPAGVVLALDRATGAVRWKRDMPDAVLGPIAADANRAICCVRNGEVVALSLADGRVLWRQRVSDRSPVLAGAVLTPQRVYAVSKDGHLAVLDAADGRLLDKQTLNDPKRPGTMGLCFSTPTLAGGCVYVGSETGGLRCFGPKRE